MLIDTHCHLDFPDFKYDTDKVIENALGQGVEKIINIGSSLKGSIASLELARRYPFIYASVGIHPHAAEGFNPQIFDQIKDLAKNQKVVAIGEIGLDYYKNYSSVSSQKKMFGAFLELAKELNLPVIIHSRQAQNDILDMLKIILPHPVQIHCFSADKEFMQRCLELGFFISFTCNITYKNASLLRQLIKDIPLERLLLETDSPFLPPEGLRGRRNEPANVKILAEEIARIKEMEWERIASVTSANAKQLFRLE